MKNNKKMIFSSIILIVGVVLTLVLWEIYGSKYMISIPKIENILFVEIHESEKNKYMIIEGDSISEVYDALIRKKKPTKHESINDAPIESRYIKIDITDKKNIISTFYAYEGNNGGYYIEQPYNGVYKIEVEDYEIFNQYFI